MIGHIGSVEGQPLSGEDIEGVVKRLLVGPADGWQGWALRLFELAPGGHTPRHHHPWPHINYITAGRGILHIDGTDNAVEAGSFAYVPAGATHQFGNAGDETFAFLCIVPAEGES
ncbi:MAG TPA: cupin domain-containing protein [Thermoleophilia bacterium]|nr:cupin domain-containing protein [Thermoleophilia bacterium]